MPPRGKRVMLVVSVYQQLVREGVFQEETLEKLNSRLFLVKNEELLPWLTMTGYSAWDHALLHKTIQDYVKGKISDSCLTYIEARRISEALVDIAPQCLTYARREEMVKDLIELFYCQTSEKFESAIATS